VRIAAAANLKFALDELANPFRKHYPEIELGMTYGSSGNFFAQLMQKAPFDLFLSADVDYPHMLVEHGLAAKDAEFVYAIGRIVVWMPIDSSLDLDRLGVEALAAPTVRK